MSRWNDLGVTIYNIPRSGYTIYQDQVQENLPVHSVIMLLWIRHRQQTHWPPTPESQLYYRQAITKKKRSWSKLRRQSMNTVHEQYKDSAVGPNQYHLLITLDCCCLSYRMFGLIFKSMSIPGKHTVNILFHNIIITGLSKKTRTVGSPRHNHI